MDGVAGLLADPGADVLPDADDVAGRAHTDQAAIIGNAVKLGVDLHPARAEFGPHVKGKFHIRTVYVRHFANHRVKFIAVGIQMASFLSGRTGRDGTAARPLPDGTVYKMSRSSMDVLLFFWK